MQIDDSHDNGEVSQAFSYDVLDQEAAKISSIILAVNQKMVGGDHTKVAHELLDWADKLTAAGKLAEAEFLYLHAINLCHHRHSQYPMVFTSLRDFAVALSGKTSTVVELRSVTIIESNAA